VAGRCVSSATMSPKQREHLEVHSHSAWLSTLQLFDSAEICVKGSCDKIGVIVIIRNHCVGSSRPLPLPPLNLSHTLTPALPGVPGCGRLTVAGSSDRGGLIAAANSRGAPSASWTLSRSVPPRSTSPAYSSPASFASPAASPTSRPSIASTTYCS